MRPHETVVQDSILSSVYAINANGLSTGPCMGYSAVNGIVVGLMTTLGKGLSTTWQSKVGLWAKPV